MDEAREKRARLAKRGGGSGGNKRREIEGKRGQEKDVYRTHGREKLQGGGASSWSR